MLENAKSLSRCIVRCLSHPESGVITITLLFVLVAFSGTWISLGGLHEFDNGDSVVPVLISTQHWTPYFWASNRFGMLIPLIASPFHNLLANLVIQEALTTCSALLSGFLLVRFLFGNRPFWFAAAALQNSWAIILVPKDVLFDWFVINCYGVSFALGFSALILCEKRKWLLAILFIVLAHWVNFGVFILLFPVVILRHLIEKDRTPFFVLLVLLGAIAGWGFVHISPYHDTKIGFIPIAEWPHTWHEVLVSTQHFIVTKPMSLFFGMLVPAGIGLGALLLQHRIRIALTAIGLLCAAGVYGIIVCTQVWVRMNFYLPRFIFGSLFLAAIAAAILTIGAFQSAVPNNAAAILATILLCVASMYSYGRPSLTRVHHILDQRFGRFTPDILQSRVAVVAGTYWTVWPAVFHANLILQEDGERRTIYGLSYRALETVKFWINQPKLCVAVPDHDAEASHWEAEVGLQLKPATEYPSIQTFCRP